MIGGSLGLVITKKWWGALIGGFVLYTLELLVLLFYRSFPGYGVLSCIATVAALYIIFRRWLESKRGGANHLRD